MVAEAMNFTADPSSRSALQIVRVLVIRASASLTIDGVNSSPGR
jgi:hypothetical protein